ncbi:MAG: response regulator [bacterium]
MNNSLHILLAEDNSINQMIVTRLLEKYGHKVVIANNGFEAVACLQKEYFDLILMDVEMPKMDGLEATKKIREQEEKIKSGEVVCEPESSFVQAREKKIPIIALTAHAMKGDKERFLEAGMDGYLAKPINVEDLFEVIKGVAVRK